MQNDILSDCVDLIGPEGAVQPRMIPLAARVPDLVGRKVGLLDNTKGNADLLLTEVERLLVARYAPAEIVRQQKRQRGAPASAEILRALRSCDAVITAIGD